MGNFKDFVTGKSPQGNKEKNIESTQNFSNIRDIRGQFFYSVDGYVFSYIKIEPISIDLFSTNELRTTANVLSAEFNREKGGYSFHSLDMAVDIKPYIRRWKDMCELTNNITRKKLLSEYMCDLGEMAHSGRVTQKVFFFALWEPFTVNVEEVMSKRINAFSNSLKTGKVLHEVMQEQAIKALFLHYNNPSMSHLDNGKYNNIIPFIKDLKEDSSDEQKDQRDTK